MGWVTTYQEISGDPVLQLNHNGMQDDSKANEDLHKYKIKLFVRTTRFVFAEGHY